MQKSISVLMLLFFFAVSIPHTIADLKLPETPTVQDLVNKYATQYNVSPKKMMAVIKCENKTLDPNLQSHLKYKKGNRWKKPPGSYEQSYGLVQIHLPDHPNITLEQATDSEFSVDFLASQISKGNIKMWSCAKVLRLG